MNHAATWQMVTGAQGSLVTTGALQTDIAGLTMSTYYLDQNPANPLPCTGDAAAWGQHGTTVVGPGGIAAVHRPDHVRDREHARQHPDPVLPQADAVHRRRRQPGITDCQSTADDRHGLTRRSFPRSHIVDSATETRGLC